MKESLIHEHGTFEFQEMNISVITILPYKAMGLCRAFNTYLRGICIDIGNISRLLLPLTF